MKFRLDRVYMGETYTIGKLYVENHYICDVLEDRVRELGSNGEGKIWGETAIPEGEYEIVLTDSPRFKRPLPLLLDVPHFEGIRIHSGNFGDYTKIIKKIKIDNTKEVLNNNFIEVYE